MLGLGEGRRRANDSRLCAGNSLDRVVGRRSQVRLVHSLGRLGRRGRERVSKRGDFMNSRKEKIQMQLLADLLAKPATLPTASKYTAMNGIIYLSAGALLILWPGATQTIFRDRDFVGDEAALIRVMGLTVVVIGWLSSPCSAVAPGHDRSSPLRWSTAWCSCPLCSCRWRSRACSRIWWERSRFSTRRSPSVRG